jgi:hypothetical protein
MFTLKAVETSYGTESVVPSAMISIEALHDIICLANQTNVESYYKLALHHANKIGNVAKFERIAIIEGLGRLYYEESRFDKYLIYAKKYHQEMLDLYGFSDHNAITSALNVENIRQKIIE